MGLDISYYGKLALRQPLSSGGDEEDGDLYDRFHLVLSHSLYEMVEKDFPGRTEGLAPGCYDSEGDQGGFRAGSYSGYGWWRSKLDAFRGPNTNAFSSLIHFYDNEGYIGPVVSKMLANDFAEHEAVICARARALLGAESSYWIGKYQEWKRAFEVASDNGCVYFH